MALSGKQGQSYAEALLDIYDAVCHDLDGDDIDPRFFDAFSVFMSNVEKLLPEVDWAVEWRADFRGLASYSAAAWGRRAFALPDYPSSPREGVRIDG